MSVCKNDVDVCVQECLYATVWMWVFKCTRVHQCEVCRRYMCTVSVGLMGLYLCICAVMSV